MVVRLVNAFLFGAIFVLLLDFILFTGMKLYYFDYYGIDIYFNTLFVDNQPWWLLLPLALMLGYAMLYLRGSRIFDRLYIVLFLLSATAFYPPVGKGLGERLFMQKGIYAKVLGKEMVVDILYRGRDGIYLKKPGSQTAMKVAYGNVEQIKESK